MTGKSPLDPRTQRYLDRIGRVLAQHDTAIKQLSRQPRLGYSSIESDDGDLQFGPILAGASGVRVLIPSPDGIGFSQAIALGTPNGNAWQSTDAEGNILGSMSAGGDTQCRTLGVVGVAQFGDGLWMQGEPAGGASPGDGTQGPTINGRDLIGPQVQEAVASHPADIGDSPWLESFAAGMLNQGNRACSGWAYSGLNGLWHWREIGTLSWTAVEGRVYMIVASFPAWEATDTDTSSFGASFLKISTDPTGRVGLDTNGRFLRRLYAPSGTWYSAQTTAWVRCPQDIPAGQASVLMGNYVYGNRTAVHANTTDSTTAEMAVADFGRAIADNGMVERDGQMQGTSTAPAAPDPPPPSMKAFTWTRDATDFITYRGDGSRAPSVYNGVAAQGLCPSATQNGVLRSEIVFPSAVPTLNGATDIKVEVKLHFSHWWNNAGGTACIGTHGGLGTPSRWGDITNRKPDQMRRHFDEPDGHWVTLDPATYDDWKAGRARGILLTARDVTDRSSEYYGICNGASIRITGRK